MHETHLGLGVQGLVIPAVGKYRRIAEICY